MKRIQQVAGLPDNAQTAHPDKETHISRSTVSSAIDSISSAREDETTSDSIATNIKTKLRKVKEG